MPGSTSRSSSDGDPPADLEKQTPRDNTTHTEETRSPEKVPGSNDNEVSTQWKAKSEPERDTTTDGAPGVLSRVLSRVSSNVSSDPGPPPDGGAKAWLMCLCGHFIVMNTWGFINSFGVFQTYYTQLLGMSASDISWIGSLTVFITFFIGTFTGRLVDAGFLRPVLIVGTIFLTLGIFTTSAATEYWQLILAQGITMGIGCGWLFCAAITTVATYFSTKRSFAIGLTASGSASGGLIYPAMARQLLPTIGFPWTMRAMGFVMLATMLIVITFLRSRVPPRRAGSLVEWAAFRELEYTFYSIGMFFNFWSLYFAFYYLGAFSQSANVHPTLTYVESLNLVLIINGASVFGRLPPAYLADRYGPLTLLAPASLIGSITVFTWMAVKTPPGLYIWTVFYAIVAGGMQGLFPAGVSSLTTDPRKQGTRIGMVFTIVSFATLTGNPIAGAIIAANGGRYVGAQAFTAVSMLIGTTLITCARIVRMRRTGEGWGVKI